MTHKEYIPPAILFRLRSTQSSLIISSHPQVPIPSHKRADDAQWHKGDSSSAAEQKQAAPQCTEQPPRNKPRGNRASERRKLSAECHRTSSMLWFIINPTLYSLMGRAAKPVNFVITSTSSVLPEPTLLCVI